MASTDARPVPIKNTAFRAVFPILDADGDLVTGASSLDSEVSKDQGTFADCTNEATEIATNSGMYYLDLTSTEMNADCVAVIVKTGTAGAKTTVLVFYPEETGDINVDVTAFGGTAGTFASGRPEVNTSHIAGSAVSTSSAQIGVNVVNFGGSAGTFASGRPEVNTTHAAGTAWGSGAITAASIASDAITAAKIADGAIDAATFAAGAINAAAIASDAITDAKVASDVTIASVTGAVGSVTGNVGGNVTGSVGSVVGAVGSVTATVSADVVSISGDSTAADNLETALDDTAGAVKWFNIVDQGTAQSATSTTLVLRAAAAFADDELIGCRIVITGGSAGVGQSRLITDYVSATDTATVSAWTTTPTGTITYKIYGDTAAAGGSAPTAAEVADAVWDEARSGHVSAGTFGEGVVAESLNAQAKADVNAEADTALTDYGALKPTTAGRTLDVSAGGEAGVDWANVGSPTTTVGLSGTTVKTATDVETDTADIQSRLPAALTAGGNIKADALAISGDTTAADNLEAATDGTGYNVGNGSVVAASVTGAVGSVTGAVGSVTGAVGSVTGNVGGNVTGSVGSLATQAKADVNTEVVDALTVDVVADSVATDGSRPTLAQGLLAIYRFLMERSVSGTTLTVKKEDGSTTSMTFTLNDATTPTSITRAS